MKKLKKNIKFNIDIPYSKVKINFFLADLHLSTAMQANETAHAPLHRKNRTAIFVDITSCV